MLFCENNNRQKQPEKEVTFSYLINLNCALSTRLKKTRPTQLGSFDPRLCFSLGMVKAVEETRTAKIETYLAVPVLTRLQYLFERGDGRVGLFCENLDRQNQPEKKSHFLM